MSEFMKNKVNFALALLGTLFVLFQFKDSVTQLSSVTDFDYTYPSGGWYVPVRLVYAFGIAGALLALSVYFYAMAITTERSSGRLERAGNFAYALAIMVLPLYALLILSHLAAVQFGFDHLHYSAPAVLIGVLVLWVGLSVLLRWRLSRQDRRAQIRQLAHLEVDHVRKARDMYQHHHYDMAVIEAWKALEARLHRLLLHRGYIRHMTPAKMIDIARKTGVLNPDLQQSVQHLRQQWNVAIGTTPLTKEAAETALAASRKLMSALPVEDQGSQDVASRKV